MRYLIEKWMTNRAFNALLFIIESYKMDSKEYKDIITVLDILRKRFE